VRGCLSVLVLAVVLVTVGVWFAGPPIAAGLVQTALASAGLHAGHLDVAVQADPPLELALGRADRITVDGTDVQWNGHQADSLHMTLNDVNLLDRSAERTTGRLLRAELPGVEPVGSTATIDFDGRGSTATVAITIDRATAQAIASAAIEQKVGIRPSSVTLRSPNLIQFKIGPVDASSAMSVDADGSLAVSTPQGKVTILDPDATRPVHLTGVAVQGDEVVLTGTLDVAALLG
jgi:hypothetical protein